MISITDVVAVIGLCITAFKTGYVIGKNSRKNILLLIMLYVKKILPYYLTYVVFITFFGFIIL